MQSYFLSSTKKKPKPTIPDLANRLRCLTYFGKTSSLTVSSIIDSVFPSYYTEENLIKLSKDKNVSMEEIKALWKKNAQEGILIHQLYQKKLCDNMKNVSSNATSCNSKSYIETEFPVIFKSLFGGSIDALEMAYQSKSSTATSSSQTFGIETLEGQKKSNDDKIQFKIIEIKSTNDTDKFFQENIEKAFCQLLLYKEMLGWMMSELGFMNNLYDIKIEIHLIDRSNYFKNKILDAQIIKSSTKSVNKYEIKTLTMQYKLKNLINKLMKDLDAMADKTIQSLYFYHLYCSEISMPYRYY